MPKDKKHNPKRKKMVKAARRVVPSQNLSLIRKLLAKTKKNPKKK